MKQNREEKGHFPPPSLSLFMLRFRFLSFLSVCLFFPFLAAVSSLNYAA